MTAFPCPSCLPFLLRDPLPDLFEVFQQAPFEVAVKAVEPVALLATPVGQPVAVPAAEVACVGRQVELADAAVAGPAIDDQRADEPPAEPPEARPRRGEADRVALRLLPLVPPPGPRVPEPDGGPG